MRSSQRIVFLLTLCLGIVAAALNSYASHVRAGEITIRRLNLNSRTFEITITLYRDTRGVAMDRVEVDFGAGEEPTIITTGTTNVRYIGNETEEHIFTFLYEYPGPGTYTVSAKVINRNAQILNISRGPSDGLSFYVETVFLFNPSVGLNTSPTLSYPPIDIGRVGQRFVHNPGAYDLADGDSLSYRMTIPKIAPGTDVPDYRAPNDAEFGGRSEANGAPTFTLDPIRGDLIWDSPGKVGQYNVAFIIEEWRLIAGRYIKIAEIVRDMQIIILDNINNRPTIEIPNDTCIVAGAGLENFVRATDPDNNRIRLRAFGELFDPEFTPPLATFTPNGVPQPSPATGTFRWQTNCEHVRNQPYQVLFQAEDMPPPRSNRDTTLEDKLVDLATWRIRVVGPPPTGLVAAPEGRTVRLSWDSYSCPNATEMVIYRRAGCGPIDSTCLVGPEAAAAFGYQAVGRVPIGTTTFVDEGPLERGISYSYRIAALFSPPAGGASLISAEQCVSLLLDVPFITNVSVESTDAASGQMLVRWTQPTEIDPAQFPGPYRYELYRGTGFAGAANQLVLSRTVAGIGPENDTTFTDSGLNTLDNPYHYVLRFYSAGQLIDSTASASSVRLSAEAQPYAVSLAWQAQVPWSNENQAHRLYRQNAQGQFVLLTEVAVTTAATFQFTDDGAGQGLDSDSTYCYFVETVGRYGDPKIIAPLLNRSQIICASPIDTLRPCPPVLAIDALNCDSLYALLASETPPPICSQESFANVLSWQYPFNSDGACDEDIVAYRLYYKRYEEDTDFTLIATLEGDPPSTQYIHENLPSYAGCYYVTAVDEDGDESDPSNIVCKDNCPYYELPNVITPNGDGKNDVFRPRTCPLFVEAVSFTVYNRWGRPVFSTSSNILINWDGRLNGDETSSGTALSAGVYYYLAEVRFQRLRRSDEKIQIKGWVHVLR
jgi:gliding motility-associated-like protein